jgi:NTP-dependent ternary system trypsin peptidase co-occuring protein
VTQLLRWQTGHGPLVAEVDGRDAAYPSIRSSAGGVVRDAAGRFEDALEGVRAAAVTALETFRDDKLQPDEVGIEFGVKLNAEAGAVIAKTSLEGHLVVTLRWARDPAADPSG